MGAALRRCPKLVLDNTSHAPLTLLDKYFLRHFLADSNTRVFNIDNQIAAHRADNCYDCARYKTQVLQMRSDVGVSADAFDYTFFTDDRECKRHSNTPFPFVN